MWVLHSIALRAASCLMAGVVCSAAQVSLPTQYNNRNQDPVGALSSALARLQSNKPLRELREVAKGITKQLPQPIQVRAQELQHPTQHLMLASITVQQESQLAVVVMSGVDWSQQMLVLAVACTAHKLAKTFRGSARSPAMASCVLIAVTSHPLLAVSNTSTLTKNASYGTCNFYTCVLSTPLRVLQVATSKIDEYARGMISGSGSTLFEELGLYYIGPVDGHNVDDLVAVLNDVKSADTVGPVLVHVITEKGRGYLPAETAQDKMHGVVKFDPRTG